MALTCARSACASRSLLSYRAIVSRIVSALRRSMETERGSAMLGIWITQGRCAIFRQLQLLHNAETFRRLLMSSSLKSKTKNKKKEDDNIYFNKLKNTLAHLGAFANFEEADFFLTAFKLCTKFCLREKTYKPFVGSFVEYAHRTEIKKYKNKPKLLSEIYGHYDPESERNTSFLMEIIFCRYVDYLLEYVKDLCSVIVLAKAGDLNFKKEFSVKDILECKDETDLIESILSSEIQKISYGDKKQLDKFLRQFLLQNVVPKKEEEKIVEYIRKRNEIIHGRGVRNVFGRKKGERSRKTHSITLEMLMSARNDIWSYIGKLDKRAMKKYDLFFGHIWLMGQVKGRQFFKEALKYFTSKP